MVESSLGTVPNADKVDGMGAAKWSKRDTALNGSAETLVAALGGLEVWVGCQEQGDPADHEPVIRVKSSVANATVVASVVAASATAGTDTDLDPGEDLTIISGSGIATGVADVVYSTPAGSVVTAEIGWAGLTSLPTNTCHTHGVLFGG